MPSLARPLRILVSTHVYPPRFVGGAELMAHELALALTRRGHEVRVFAGDLDGPVARGQRLDDRLDGLMVHRVGLDPRDYDPAWQNLVHPEVDRHLAAVLDEFRPDIIHAHNLMGLSLRLPALAADRGIRTIVTLHDFWGICLRNTLMRPDGSMCQDTSACRQCLPANEGPDAVNLPMRLRKDAIELALSSVAAFVSPSRFLAERYLAWGLPASRMNVIPNGIDTAPFAQVARIASDAVRILYVGYLGLHKGVSDLVDAVAAMQNRSQVQLTFVGIGPEEAALRKRVADAGLSQVAFAGRIPPERMPQAYAEADILVLPSVWAENQPVSIMEAMASGVAVVASRIGGIPEIIEDDVTGRLVEAGDVAMLAGVLDDLASAPSRRAELVCNARAQVANRSFAAQAATIEALLGDVLSQKVLPQSDRPIIGIMGDCRGRSGDPDATDLPSEVLARSLLAPAEWLTSGQRQRCAGLRHYRSQDGREGALQRMQFSVLGALWPVLPVSTRARLIARAQRLWPNFPVD